MLDTKIIMTRGIYRKIPAEAYLKIWKWYYSMTDKRIWEGYPHCYKLSITPDGKQKIVHVEDNVRQNEERIIKLKYCKPVDEKIFVCRDKYDYDKYVDTMLLTDEY